MKVKVCIALALASIACSSLARDMQTIQQSGELRVGVPGDYARWRFITAPASCSAMTLIWQRILARSWG